MAKMAGAGSGTYNRVVMGNQERLRAYLRLHLAPGVGPNIFRRLLEHFGGAEAAGAAGAAQWRKVKGVGEKLAAELAAVGDAEIDAELAEVERLGAHVLCVEDDDYPTALKAIFDPPAVLYVRGRLAETDALAMGVVGARRCTHYGAEQAERFGQFLGRAGFTVVSGGARGIDTAAHRGAMSAGARTIAVMGCGLATAYPPENAKLFDQIIADDCGALLSEIPMTYGVRAANFHARNRVISGLSLGVVVVEAAKRSGALITARQAAEQGRVVFAVPGRLDSPLSAGTHGLIRDGAVLATNLEDVLDQLGDVGKKMGDGPGESGDAPAALPTGLDENESSVVSALSEGPLTLDELVRRTELDSGRAAACMTMLVLKGYVTQQAGNVFVRKR